MAIKKERCTECNGSGTVLKHMYGQEQLNGTANHGPGQVSCPRCFGRGYRDVMDNDATGHDKSLENQYYLELGSQWYSMLCVLAFVGAVMYGIGLFEDSNSPIAMKIKTEFINPIGPAAAFGVYTAITILSLIAGIYFRRILRWIALFLILGFSGWVIYQLLFVVQ